MLQIGIDFDSVIEPHGVLILLVNYGEFHRSNSIGLLLFHVEIDSLNSITYSAFLVNNLDPIQHFVILHKIQSK